MMFCIWCIFNLFYLFNNRKIRSLLTVIFYMLFSPTTLFFIFLSVPLYSLYFSSSSFHAVPSLSFILYQLSFHLPFLRSLCCCPSSLLSLAQMWPLSLPPAFSCSAIVLKGGMFSPLLFLFLFFLIFVSDLFLSNVFSSIPTKYVQRNFLKALPITIHLSLTTLTLSLSLNCLLSSFEVPALHEFYILNISGSYWR